MLNIVSGNNKITITKKERKAKANIGKDFIFFVLALQRK